MGASSSVKSDSFLASPKSIYSQKWFRDYKKAYKLNVPVAVEHNILGFEVSVHDFETLHVVEHLDHLRRVHPAQGRCEAFGTQKVGQVSILAHLKDKVQPLLVHVYTQKLDDELMVELFQKVSFPENRTHFAQLHYLLLADLLDGHDLTSLLVFAEKHLSVGALSDLSPHL